MEINKKILASVFVISILAFGLGYGTYSYFSDTEESTGNEFTAGTLDLIMGDPVIIGADLDNLKPGDEVTGTVTVTNGGSIGGYLYGRMTYEETADPGDDSDLGDVLIVTRWKDNEGECYPGISLYTNVYANPDPLPTVTFDEKEWHQYGYLASGASLTFEMDILFDPEAGDIYQGDSISVTFEFLLYQISLVP